MSIFDTRPCERWWKHQPHSYIYSRTGFHCPGVEETEQPEVVKEVEEKSAASVEITITAGMDSEEIGKTVAAALEPVTKMMEAFNKAFGPGDPDA